MRAAEAASRHAPVFAYEFADDSEPSLTRWPPFRPGGHILGLSADSIALTPFADDHHCDFWAKR